MSLKLLIGHSQRSQRGDAKVLYLGDKASEMDKVKTTNTDCASFTVVYHVNGLNKNNPNFVKPASKPAKKQAKKKSGTDAPSTDAPATDAPTTDAPATDAPATGAPTTDAPATDAPATDAPATDAPATE
jgi:hypothetical protein